jgi:hypothetical protein
MTRSIMQNTELLVFPQIVGYQSSLREWHHWLYKYNLLHRGVLQDSSCVSFIKQLIAPSFHSSTAVSRNMWASSITSPHPTYNPNAGNCYEALYGNSSLLSWNTFLKKDLFFRTVNNLDQIMFYNSSYNWFLQRFYSFNTLSTNLTIWNEKPGFIIFTPQFTAQKDYNISMQNFSWYLNKSQRTYSTPFTTMGTSYATLSQATQLQPYHDVYLNYFDYTIFSKLNSETALSLTVNQGSPILKFFTLQNIFT